MRAKNGPLVLAISALFGNINVSGFGGSVGGLICVQKGGRRELGDYKYRRLLQGASLEKQRNEVVAEVRSSVEVCSVFC